MNARLPFTQISQEALPARLSILGYIKVGGKQKQVRWGRRGPYTLPERFVEPVRFEVTTREQVTKSVENPQKKGDYQQVALGYQRDEKIHGLLGAQPTTIPIRLMFPTAAENFICHFGAHNGTKWVCQGDGVRGLDLVRGEVPCTCPRLKQFEGEYKGPEFTKHELGATDNKLWPCKPRGVLSAIIDGADTFGGFWAFKTTSYESIANIRTQLQLFEGQFGRIDGLPFLLQAYPATKSYGDGSTTQPIVTVVLQGSFDTARQLAADKAQPSHRWLTAGGTLDPQQHRQVLAREMEEEAQAEGGEFYPETGETGEAREAPATMEEKLRARAKGQQLPVVQGSPAEDSPSASDDGPDFEVIDEQAEDEADASEPAGDSAPPTAEPAGPRGARTGKTLSELAAEYNAKLTEKRPKWGDAERRLWQAQRVGKALLSDWEAEDYELGIMLLDRGQLELQATVPVPAGGKRKTAQAELGVGG